VNPAGLRCQRMPEPVLSALRWLRELARSASAHDVPFCAAAVAFYAWLSLFPLLLIGMSGLGVWLSSADARQQTLEVLARSAPVLRSSGIDFDRLLQSIAEGRSGAGIAGVLLLLWSASQVVVALQHSLNRIFDATRRSIWGIARLKSVGFVIYMGLLAALSLAATVAFGVLTPRLPGKVLYAAVSLALNATLAASAYVLLPRVRVPWKQAFAGGLVTALLWLVANSALVAYFSQSARFSSLYGPLASTVVVLMACYFLALILLLGAEITRALMPRRGETASRRSSA